MIHKIFNVPQQRKAYVLTQHVLRNVPYGKLPYMFHINECIVIGLSYNLTEDEMTALILHDVVEESYFSIENIEELFGKSVANIVDQCTDELIGEDGQPLKNRKSRKKATYKKVTSCSGVTVKLIDRLANITHSCEEKNTGKMKMYLKEWEEFQDGMKRAIISSPKVDWIWGDLDTIFNNIQQ